MTTIIRNQLIGLDEEDEPPGKTVSVESTAAEEPPVVRLIPGGKGSLARSQKTAGMTGAGNTATA